MYDIVIRGGYMVDSRNRTEGPRDLAVQNRKIAEVASEISPGRARNVIDASGKLVMPGIVDTEVHIPVAGESTSAHRKLARAGVTTALEFLNYRSMVADLPDAGSGITVAGVQEIGPFDRDLPSPQSIDQQIEAAMREGALGVKILGGHHPSTPEATARIIERANRVGAYVGYHVGTTIAPSTLDGLRQALDLVGPYAVQIPHINAYLRGATADVLSEHLEAFRLLRRAPHVVTESHLAPFNGCSGECRDGTPVDDVLQNCLRLRGFEVSARGVREALLAGYAHVRIRNGESRTLLTGQAALDKWEAAGTRISLSFPVNLRSTAFLCATARQGPYGLAFEGPGEFVIDALASDGGSWRNVILRHGLDLVDFGALSLLQFVQKACDTPACMLGIPEKGHLGPGADADVLVVDRPRRQADWVVAGGKVIAVCGVVVGQGATIVTTERGKEAVSGRGLPARVVDLAKSYFYTKGRDHVAKAAPA